MSRLRSMLMVAVAAISTTALAAPALADAITMHRDPNCGCCVAWANAIEGGLGREVRVHDHSDMAALKTRLRVPAQLSSCHTAIVDGYIIEGHVPAADIARLLARSPQGVRGLAVPGMPLGSPGMEAGDRTQPYTVIAFNDSRTAVFSRHP